MDESMVERVARAICDKDGRDADRLLEAEEVSRRALPSNLSGERQWKAYVDAARAAIEAMREPTPGMVASGNDRMEKSTGETGLTIWRAMIDAALNPQSQP